ncbi:MAG: hypothetical protein U0Z53_23030 [Blastocatellia bacterium]
MSEPKSNLSHLSTSTANSHIQSETDHIIRLAVEIGRLQAELERARAESLDALRAYTQLEADVNDEEEPPVETVEDAEPETDNRHISTETLTVGRIEAREIVLTDSAGRKRAHLALMGSKENAEAETVFTLFDGNGDLRLSVRAHQGEAAIYLVSGSGGPAGWQHRATIGYDPGLLNNSIRLIDASGQECLMLTESGYWHRADEE